MFSPEKRRWLVNLLGEKRVAEIETQLPLLSKALRARGVRYKDLGGATTFAEVDTLREQARLTSMFADIAGNIINGTSAAPEKARLLKQLADDLSARLTGANKPAAAGKAVGYKQRERPGSVYANDLLNPPSAAGAKAVRDSKAPASDYLADLFERPMIAQGA